MYDSYSEYYGFNDVEVKEVKTIGGGNATESYRPKQYYTINFEPTPMTAQQQHTLNSYVDKLKTQALKHIKCLECFEMTPEREFVISECWDIINTEFVSMEHYQFVHWYFNYGNLRDEDELNQHIFNLLQEKEEVENQKIKEVSGGIATILFSIFMFFVIFIIPGALSGMSAGEDILMHIIGLNMLFIPVAGPILLFIWGISISLFGKAIDAKCAPSVKGVVATTAISAAMHTKAMSRMGKTLFSEKKI